MLCCDFGFTLDEAWNTTLRETYMLIDYKYKGWRGSSKQQDREGHHEMIADFRARGAKI